MSAHALAFNAAVAAHDWQRARTVLASLDASAPSVASNLRLLDRLQQTAHDITPTAVASASLDALRDAYNGALVALRRGDIAGALDTLGSAQYVFCETAKSPSLHAVWMAVKYAILLADICMRLSKSTLALRVVHEAGPLAALVERLVVAMPSASASASPPDYTVTPHNLKWLADAVVALRLRIAITLCDWDAYDTAVDLRRSPSPKAVLCDAFNLSLDLEFAQNGMESASELLLNENHPSVWLLHARTVLLRCRRNHDSEYVRLALKMASDTVNSAPSSPHGKYCDVLIWRTSLALLQCLNALSQPDDTPQHRPIHATLSLIHLLPTLKAVVNDWKATVQHCGAFQLLDIERAYHYASYTLGVVTMLYPSRFSSSVAERESMILHALRSFSDGVTTTVSHEQALLYLIRAAEASEDKLGGSNGARERDSWYRAHEFAMEASASIASPVAHDAWTCLVRAYVSIRLSASIQKQSVTRLPAGSTDDLVYLSAGRYAESAVGAIDEYLAHHSGPLPINLARLADLARLLQARVYALRGMRQETWTTLKKFVTESGTNGKTPTLPPPTLHRRDTTDTLPIGGNHDTLIHARLLMYAWISATEAALLRDSADKNADDDVSKLTLEAESYLQQYQAQVRCSDARTEQDMQLENDWGESPVLPRHPLWWQEHDGARDLLNYSALLRQALSRLLAQQGRHR